MSRIFIIALLLLLGLEPSIAGTNINNTLDTVTLDEATVFSVDVNQDELSIQNDNSEKTLMEKLHDIRAIEVEDINKRNFLFSEILTKNYPESSMMDSLHLWAGYNGDMTFAFPEHSNSVVGNYEFNTICAGLDGKLKDDNADFRIMLANQPLSSRTIARGMFADMYVATNKLPNTRVQIGHFRPGFGIEGQQSTFTLPFLQRSQISRNYGTVRKMGGKVQGDYRLFDYNIGMYSSSTYFKTFFPGAEFDGWLNFKPLGFTDGKYGHLTIGTGMQAGERDSHYCLTGAYLRYDYKRFFANIETAQGSGANGAKLETDKHTAGFYTTMGYRLTPKLQALVRYDEFNNNKHVSNNTQREYTAGLNYFIKGNGLKIMLNYVFCQNQSTKDSHKIMLGTQILL